MHLRFAPLLIIVAFTACAELEPEAEPEGEASEMITRGENGETCKRSRYNCSLRAGGQRVRRADGGETWAVDPAKSPVPVVDGNGEEMGRSTFSKFTLNYGQSRRIDGVRYVYALSTGLASGGWVPIDAFADREALAKAIGKMDAKGANLSPMACYEIGTTYPARLDTLKVVRGAKEGEAKEPNDYLPQVRKNGEVYGTLSFNVPGDDLGGANTDIFPAGTKFQRLNVPTAEGAPSLDAKLYARTKGTDKYTTPAGAMKFIYGYVTSTTGEVRYGWAALDGLEVSSDCDPR
ncbi:MAG: hypothetical protein KIT84_17770 [Labilithrix sp.]|nr:hypothetical protein [Labilithrix sp.]MCW5812882.1 hypothetical protein [Labilithrix sp.]